MGRNNVDFFGGGGFHFSPTSNRNGIEKHGLRPGAEEPGFEADEPPASPSGVYVYNTKKDSEKVMGGTNTPHDIWQVHIPLNHMEYDGHLQSADASYSPKTVPPNLLSRVGHTTSTGKIHWHPEEQCRG